MLMRAVIPALIVATAAWGQTAAVAQLPDLSSRGIRPEGEDSMTEAQRTAHWQYSVEHRRSEVQGRTFSRSSDRAFTYSGDVTNETATPLPDFIADCELAGRYVVAREFPPHVIAQVGLEFISPPSHTGPYPSRGPDGRPIGIEVAVGNVRCRMLGGRNFEVLIEFRRDPNAGRAVAAPTPPPEPTRPVSGPILRSRRIEAPPTPPPARPREVFRPAERPAPPPSEPVDCPRNGGGCGAEIDGPVPEHIRRRNEAYQAALEEANRRDAAERQRIEELNAAQRRENEAWVAQEQQRQQDYQAAPARQAAAAEAIRAEAARQQAAHEAAMEAWRRRVSACQAGDRSQCAPQ